MVRDKVRIRFRKGGELRLVSHHDLMRCFERMLRRADLPFHSTEGFNPKPRLVFALSLGLGIVGAEEVVELELDHELPAEEILEKLRRQAPSGLELFQANRIDLKSTAQVHRVSYRISIPPEKQTDLPEKLAAIQTDEHCWVERVRPTPRRVDVRGYIRDLSLRNNVLEMDLEVTPQGTARPDDILQVLGLKELLTEGAILERSKLELLDETTSARANACC
jgi:radical SAM-linked protein